MLVDIIDDQAYLASGQEKLLHEVIEAAANTVTLADAAKENPNPAIKSAVEILVNFFMNHLL